MSWLSVIGLKDRRTQSPDSVCGVMLERIPVIGAADAYI